MLADPAERVWLEVAPAGPLKEGDRVEIRCLADGNPPPHFSLSKQVRGGAGGAGRAARAGRAGGRRPLLTPLRQDPRTRETVEETTDDDGVLVLAPARREHSGRYQCQGLDLESTASLLSAQQELRVDCERGRAAGRAAGGPSTPRWPTRLLCPQMCLMSGCAPRPLKATRAATSR